MTWVMTGIFSIATEPFWALCHDSGLCHDLAWSRPRGLVSQHSKCVATGWRNERALQRAFETKRAWVGTTRECRDIPLMLLCRDGEFSVLSIVIDHSCCFVGIENSMS